MQKVEKIRLRISSAVVSPVRLSSWRSAPYRDQAAASREESFSRPHPSPHPATHRPAHRFEMTQAGQHPGLALARRIAHYSAKCIPQGRHSFSSQRRRRHRRDGSPAEHPRPASRSALVAHHQRAPPLQRRNQLPFVIAQWHRRVQHHQHHIRIGQRLARFADADGFGLVLCLAQTRRIHQLHRNPAQREPLRHQIARRSRAAVTIARSRSSSRLNRRRLARRWGARQSPAAAPRAPSFHARTTAPAPAARRQLYRCV